MTKEILVKRLKSLAWRVGAMALALVLQFVLDNLTDFNLNPLITTLVGLVIGEVTKYLNTNYR